MAYNVKIIADSINVVGNRLTTFELTYPRFIHSELLTHRMFSRNSASSRAIPVEKLIQRVIDDPVIPLRWGAAQKGMIAGDNLPPDELNQRWLAARDSAIAHARFLLAQGCHKTLPNRLLETWMWITVVVTATEWDNFFTLRTAPDAEDHFRHLALIMLEEYADSIPHLLQPGEWHLPLALTEDASAYDLPRVSAGRCARVSYLTHDGKRDPVADMALCDRLVVNRHMSPLEHPAMALGTSERVANFTGWVQLRRMVSGV